MRPHLIRLALCLAPLLLPACSLEPVRRTIELTPHVDLPAGTALLHAGGALHVELGEVEPLAEGHAYVAWISTATSTLYVGEVSAEAPLVVQVADLGLGVDDVEELRVTIEEATALPLAAPTAPPS